MLSNYYTLGYLASSLDSTIRGWKIGSLYSQNRDEIILQFDAEDEHLVISCSPAAPVMYLQGGMARAKRNSVDLLPAARGSTITGVSIRPADRVVIFSLSPGIEIAALFYGTKSNVLVIEPSGRIIDAFKGGRKLVGTVFRLPDGELLHDVSAFRTRASTPPPGTAVSMVKKSFPVLGTTLVTEVFHRSGVSPARAADTLTPREIGALEAALHSLLGDLARPAPRLYCREDGTPTAFSLIPLAHAEGGERRYESIHDAIRFYLSRRDAASARDEEKHALTSVLQQRLMKMRRTRQAMQDDIQVARRADDYERFAQLLMANLGVPPRGEKSFTVETSGGPEIIPLNPALSTLQNAQHYFEKAKRSRASTAGAGERVPEVEARIALAGRLLQEAEACRTREDVRTFMTENAGHLDRLGIGEKKKAHEDLPFRIFTVEGGFEVWAGKSSANNDLLTLRHARPEDLWFHARGASGSHVVLKIRTGKGEPGKKAREQAAGIAAYYSRMKNAKMVPVAMTEKRYVRKPRGAPPGTVVIEREKVIFAEPALPSPPHDE
jgi:predicted ribosome quality control (RQC) complex YloA/Tae2 family protein